MIEKLKQIWNRISEWNSAIREEAVSLRKEMWGQERPSIKMVFRSTMARYGTGIKVFHTTPRIIFLGLIQWLIIIAGISLAVVIVPEFFGEMARLEEQGMEHEGESPLNLIAGIFLVLWEFLIIGLVMLPFGLITSCMGVLYMKKRLNGEDATITESMRHVLSNARRIWIFVWIDTFMKRNQGGSDTSIFDALFAFVYGVITMGMRPLLTLGYGIKQSASYTYALMRANAYEAIGIRLVFTTVTSLIYVAAIGLFMAFYAYQDAFPGLPPFLPGIMPGGDIFFAAIFYWIGTFVLSAACINLCIVRPIYTIATFNLFCEMVEAKGDTMTFSDPQMSEIKGLVVGYATLVAVTVACYFIIPPVAAYFMML